MCQEYKYKQRLQPLPEDALMGGSHSLVTGHHVAMCGLVGCQMCQLHPFVQPHTAMVPMLKKTHLCVFETPMVVVMTTCYIGSQMPMCMRAPIKAHTHKRSSWCLDVLGRHHHVNHSHLEQGKGTTSLLIEVVHLIEVVSNMSIGDGHERLLATRARARQDGYAM